MIASRAIELLTECIAKRGDLELNVTLLDWAVPHEIDVHDVETLVDEGSIDPLDDTFITLLVDDDFDVIYVGPTDDVR